MLLVILPTLVDHYLMIFYPRLKNALVVIYPFKKADYQIVLMSTFGSFHTKLKRLKTLQELNYRCL